MEESLGGIDHGAIYFYVYYATIALIFFVELFVPRRPLAKSFGVRWLNNIGLDIFTGYLLRFLVPIASIDLALRFEESGMGVLNFQAVTLPFWLEIMIGVLLLDFLAYVVHCAFHRYLFFWRFHLVHHADPEVDFTTHLRHHPLEVFIIMLINFLVIAIVGVSAWAIFLYSLLAHAVSLFSHGNLFLPVGVDRVLRRLIITPDMHRVHHSVDKPETNSNYGIVFPWWDRIFNTYVAQPAKGHKEMKLGLDNYRARRDLFINRLLVLPFLKQSRQRAQMTENE